MVLEQSCYGEIVGETVGFRRDYFTSSFHLLLFKDRCTSCYLMLHTFAFLASLPLLLVDG
jgi:hypothetical protein